VDRQLTLDETVASPLQRAALDKLRATPFEQLPAMKTVYDALGVAPKAGP